MISCADINTPAISHKMKCGQVEFLHHAAVNQFLTVARPGILKWVGFCKRRGSRRTGGLGDGSPPAGSRGRAPVGGLGTNFVPQKLKGFFVIYA